MVNDGTTIFTFIIIISILSVIKIGGKIKAIGNLIRPRRGRRLLLTEVWTLRRITNTNTNTNTNSNTKLNLKLKIQIQIQMIRRFGCCSPKPGH